MDARKEGSRPGVLRADGSSNDRVFTETVKAQFEACMETPRREALLSVVKQACREIQVL